MTGFSWGIPAGRGILLVSLVLLNAACGVEAPSSGSSGSGIPTYQAPEKGYCSTVTDYSSVANVTISGSAFFKRREASVAGLGNPSAARPIRYAEVRVLNASGTTVQCAETLVNGAYSFVVPQRTGTYTVEVTSRANNSKLKAYVYDDPRYNNYYSLSTTFTPTASQALAAMTAEATGDVKGGAFNILDQFLEANIFLRANVGGCAGCSNFTVAPKVTAYWKLGFNPAEYYGETGGLSFYLPGYDRLFILGGIGGDSNNEDTDHFDNSVILHEFGHFLEDNLFVSDSPGGQHNGDKLVDPRLAWSEGWGNFFQAAVRNDPYYIDTEGNSSGSTGVFYYVNLENQTRDVPLNLGEGNFREFAVTRFMWDALDNTPAEDGGNDNISSSFNWIWHSLISSGGFVKSTAAFRQIGNMLAFQAANGANWSGIRTIEQMEESTADYSQYVSTGSTCSYSLTPSTRTNEWTASNNQTDNGSFARSHLLLNNDFYHLKISSGQAVTITLEYDDADNAGTEADLDLYVYRDDYVYGSYSTMAGYSERQPDGDVTDTETESVSATLGAGNYMINVKAFTLGSIGGTVNYKIKLNGNDLCPTNLP
jgi:hypothetical protein